MIKSQVCCFSETRCTFYTHTLNKHVAYDSQMMKTYSEIPE